MFNYLLYDKMNYTIPMPIHYPVCKIPLYDLISSFLSLMKVKTLQDEISFLSSFLHQYYTYQSIL